MEPALPIYFQIKQIIQRWIVDKEFKSGERIPSEKDLVNKFNVSRLTIRQAISQLIQEGFLITKRGLGTYVTDNDKLIDSFRLEYQGFIDDLFYEVSKIKVKSAKIERIAASNYIKEKLGLKKNDKEVISIKRLRLKDNNYFAYTKNYLPVEIGKKIDEKLLYRKPLLEIIEKDLGIIFTSAFQTIEASFADNETAKYLGVTPGFPILFIERVMYTLKNKPVEVVQSSHRGDLHKYTVRLKRMTRLNKGIWIHQKP